MGKWVLICWRSFGLLVSRMIGAEIWDFDCGAKEPRDACACATSPDITKCGAKKTTRTPHYLKINGCLNNMSFSCSCVYIYIHMYIYIYIYICLIYVYVCMQVVYSFFKTQEDYHTNPSSTCLPTRHSWTRIYIFSSLNHEIVMW